MFRTLFLRIVFTVGGLVGLALPAPADTIIRSADSGFAAVPLVNDVEKEGCELCMFRIEDESRDGRPDQRWVLVKTDNGVLIKSAESGLALVPADGDKPGNFGKVQLAKVSGQGADWQRWTFVKTKHGYLIQNVASGISLVPYRDTVGENGGGLCLFRVEDESRDGRPDQNWQLTTLGPVK